MDNLDYIESYFKSEPDPGRAREFESRIESDPEFAEDVAFFLEAEGITRDASRIVKKEHFKEIYQNKNKPARPPVRKMLYYIAAAATVAGILFETYTFFKSASPQQLASRYEKEQLQTLGVTMSAKADSLQTGLRLYNDGKLNEALTQFENIIRSDTSAFLAKKYAGITALRLKEYDKALSYFEELENNKGFYANPALILEAVTLMERNRDGDAAKAKILLQRIVDEDLEGREFAEEWLKKIK